MRSWPTGLPTSWLRLLRAEAVCGTDETDSTRWVSLVVRTWVLRLAAAKMIPFGVSLFLGQGFFSASAHVKYQVYLRSKFQQQTSTDFQINMKSVHCSSSKTAVSMDLLLRA
jgi:hypothetical protein